MASIYQRKDRGNQWAVAWIGSDGTRRTQFFPADTPRRELKKFAARMETEAAAQKDIRRTVDLQTAVVHFIEDRTAVCAPATAERYRSLLIPFARAIGPATPLDRITPHRLAEWRNARLAIRSRVTVKSDCKILIAFFRWVVGRRWLAESPMATVEVPRVKRTVPPFLRPAEMETFIAAARAHPRREFYLLAVLACELGLRRGEMLYLTWRQIDFERKIITIIGKSKDPNVLPLTRLAEQALLDWPQDPSGYVFPPKYKTANRRSPHLAKEFNKWIRSLELPIKSEHGLRHSFASRLLLRGASERAIAHMMSHQSVETTRLYVHSELEQKRALMDPSPPPPTTPTPPPPTHSPAADETRTPAAPSPHPRP